MKADPLVMAIAKLAKESQCLARKAVETYAPVVDDIICADARDVREIEHTLDGLLDFCFDPNALLVFKKLCRHYYGIDPAATASYINAYRDMWDSEKKDPP